jgi:hypothetical protein
MNNQLVKKSGEIDSVVLSVIGEKNITGFQKAHIVSSAILQLETLLDAEYMIPIMALQGTSLGFRTDKDLKRDGSGAYVKGDGYPVEVVRRCLIEAVLKGYQPTNNEFNIIGGNMYPAKNGLERKANEWHGLKHSIIQTIKLFSVEKGSALVDAQIKWEINGESREETVPIPLKIDKWTSVDAVIGKGKRKALAWLLSNISGEIVVDGDVDDLNLGELGKIPAETKTEAKPVMTPELLTKAIESIVFEGVDPENIKAEYDCTPDQIKQLDEAIPK